MALVNEAVRRADTKRRDWIEEGESGCGQGETARGVAARSKSGPKPGERETAPLICPIAFVSLVVGARYSGETVIGGLNFT